MHAHHVSVASFEARSALLVAAKFQACQAGWTVLTEAVSESVRRVPMSVRVLAYAAKDVDRVVGMERLTGFVVNDASSPTDPAVHEIQGLAVAYSEPPTARWCRTVRDWRAIGWQGVARRKFGNLPTQAASNYWLFWAAPGTPHPTGLQFRAT